MHKRIAWISLAICLIACSDDTSDPTPTPAATGGAPGSVPARAQSCATIDKGAIDLIEEARKKAASGGASGADGGAGAPSNAGGYPSFCDTYYAECSDADLALLAPQFACYSANKSAESGDVGKECPGPNNLSAECNAAMEKKKPPAEKAMCSSYFECVSVLSSRPSGSSIWEGLEFISCLWAWYYAC